MNTIFNIGDYNLIFYVEYAGIHLLLATAPPFETCFQNLKNICAHSIKPEKVIFPVLTTIILCLNKPPFLVEYPWIYQPLVLIGERQV